MKRSRRPKKILVPIITGYVKGPDAFNDEGSEEIKKLFNKNVCRLVASVVGFWDDRGVDIEKEKWHALVLDGLYLGTTHALVKQNLIPLEHIDIVSKNITMEPATATVETGYLYTGLMSTFLLQELPVHSRRYEIMVLDFCGGWPGENRENIRAVQAAFMNNACMDISSMAITFSFRNGPNSPSQYIGQMLDIVRRDVAEIARLNGYSIHEKEYTKHDSSFSLFYKIICPETAMHKTRHIFQDKNGEYAMDWLMKPL